MQLRLIHSFISGLVLALVLGLVLVPSVQNMVPGTRTMKPPEQASYDELSADENQRGGVASGAWLPFDPLLGLAISLTVVVAVVASFRLIGRME